MAPKSRGGGGLSRGKNSRGKQRGGNSTSVNADIHADSHGDPSAAAGPAGGTRSGGRFTQQPQAPASGPSAASNAGRDSNQRSGNLDDEQRKRQLDEEIARGRANLRVLKERRNELERSSDPLTSRPASPISPTFSGFQPPPRSESTIAGDPVDRLAQTILTAINNSRGDSLNVSSINRLISKNETLTFSGDPLEWPRFKRAFLYSSEAGGYSDKENAVRLAKILKDDALRAVESLMISSDSAEDIMRALERRYSDNGEIFRQLISDIRKLPNLESGNTDIVSFASVINNNVTALISLGHLGSLQYPELIQDVIRKLPYDLVIRYNSYIQRLEETPSLQILADFLILEAESAKRAGTVRILNSGGRDQENRHRDHHHLRRH